MKVAIGDAKAAVVDDSQKAYQVKQKLPRDFL